MFLFSSPREQQIKNEPCTELELIAIQACAATLCCGIIKDEWFQKTVIPWLDQLMIADEVNHWVVFLHDSYWSSLDKDLSIFYCKLFIDLFSFID